MCLTFTAVTLMCLTFTAVTLMRLTFTAVTLMRLTLRSALFCDLAPRLFGVYCRRCGRTTRSHFQGHAIQKDALMMEPIGCPETSVTNYQSTPRNIQEERISHSLQFSSQQSATALDAQKV